MAELILKFNTLDPEEREEYENAINGYKYRRVLWDLDQHLREITKHGSVNGREYSESEQELVQLIRDELIDLAGEEYIEI